MNVMRLHDRAFQELSRIARLVGSQEGTPHVAIGILCLGRMNTARMRGHRYCVVTPAMITPPFNVEGRKAQPMTGVFRIGLALLSEAAADPAQPNRKLALAAAEQVAYQLEYHGADMDTGVAPVFKDEITVIAAPADLDNFNQIVQTKLGPLMVAVQAQERAKADAINEQRRRMQHKPLVAAMFAIRAEQQKNQEHTHV